MVAEWAGRQPRGAKEGKWEDHEQCRRRRFSKDGTMGYCLDHNEVYDLPEAEEVLDL